MIGYDSHPGDIVATFDTPNGVIDIVTREDEHGYRFFELIRDDEEIFGAIYGSVEAFVTLVKGIQL